MRGLAMSSKTETEDVYGQWKWMIVVSLSTLISSWFDQVLGCHKHCWGIKCSNKSRWGHHEGGPWGGTAAESLTLWTESTESRSPQPKRGRLRKNTRFFSLHASVCAHTHSQSHTLRFWKEVRYFSLPLSNPMLVLCLSTWFLSLNTIDIWGRVILCVGTVLHIVGWLTASIC